MPLLAFDEALERVLTGVERLGVESVSLGDADGRVLAEDLVAPRSLPATDQSAMDGYALALADLEGPGPWCLPVVGESRAGGVPPQVPRGVACRIFTGAALPHGTDVVVMQEAVRREGDVVWLPAHPSGSLPAGSSRAENRPRPGQNVRREGEDLARGVVALRAGIRLTPAQVGLAAALDRASVRVARRPRVALLATGDELRPPGSVDRPGSIPESNALALAAVTRRVGAEGTILPSVGDHRERLERALVEGMSQGDLLVTIGGASVGDHDLVRPILESLGARFEVAGVAMRPGKPTAFAIAGASRVLCLPGNPASAALAFHLFGVPLLRAMQGSESVRPRPLRLRVLGDHRRNLPGCDGRDDFLRASLAIVEGELRARLAPRQSSGAPTSFAEADALVVVRDRQLELRDGEACDTLLLRDLGG